MQIRGSRQVQTWYWSTRPFSAALVFVLTISEMKCEYPENAEPQNLTKELKKTQQRRGLVATFLLLISALKK